MADVRPLGVHTPVALAYLIDEGYLPEDPSPSSYQWETCAVQEGGLSVEEEVVCTKGCVVWSQSGLVRAVYRFELEGEDVQQALLTNFPRASAATQPQHNDPGKRQTEDHRRVLDGFGKNTRRSIVPDQVRRVQRETDEQEPSREGTDRALVVFLKTKAHVHYLHGSHHIVTLPFEIERAFAAPRGILLQRKLRPGRPNGYQSPQVPPAPQNSFFSQVPTQSSFLLSPSIGKSFAGSQPIRPSPLGTDGKSNEWLNGLFDSVCGAHNQLDESEAAGLYTLTSPLSDFGLVTESLQHSKPKFASKASHGINVDFDALDSAEKIAYITPTSEWTQNRINAQGNLMLLVTVNNALGLVTVWHGWYIEERSLVSLMKRRSEQKAAKLRRRSSFLSTSLNTGATTPAVRTRDVGGRESFAPGASLHVPNETLPAQPSRSLSRKPTRQDDEAAMASQMDPDYQPGASQTATRDTRRISSLVSRADSTSQNAVNGSFGGAGNRRHTSFGPGGDRRSFGPRRSRASTPGSSIFRASVGLEDDTIDMDEDETLGSVIRHIRNTYEVAGAESVFGNMDETFRPELNVRKIQSFTLGPQRSLPQQSLAVRVATLCDDLPSPEHDDVRLTVYIHDVSLAEMHTLSLEVKSRPLWPETAGSTRAAVPMIIDTGIIKQCRDFVKVSDGTSNALLVSGRGLLSSPRHHVFCALPSVSRYQRFNTLDEISTQNGLHDETGRNRMLPVPEKSVSLMHPSANGIFDEVDEDGTLHRRQVTLKPRDPYVVDILEACRLVLPVELSCLVMDVWYRAYASLRKSPESLASTACDTEWVALVSTIFYFLVDLVDEKTQAKVHMARASSGTGHNGEVKSRSRSVMAGHDFLGTPAWSWMELAEARTALPTVKPGLSTPKDQLLPIAFSHALHLRRDGTYEVAHAAANADHARCATKIMLGLHIVREEQKLNTTLTSHRPNLAPVIAQIGSWLTLDPWSPRHGSYYSFECAVSQTWSFVQPTGQYRGRISLMEEPVGVFEWIEHSFKNASTEQYPSLATIAALDSDVLMSKTFEDAAMALTPRIAAFGRLLAETQGLSASAQATVKAGAGQRFTTDVLETLPEAVSAPLREAIARCEKEPPTTWPPALLQLVGRDDLVLGDESSTACRPFGSHQATAMPSKDVQTICHALEQPTHAVKTREADRHAVSQLLFSEDRRLVEATILMHFNTVQVAECHKQPDWTDAFHFEQQRKVMQWVTTRMIALPAGDGMIHYNSQAPLMTEKYHLPGFSSSCIMQPMGHTVTTDRSGLTEEKVNWAYFHAGVSAGLRISRNARGIDTSWLVFNKPTDLTNRHAGLLLALGLSGHLRSLAKWLSFKYLTPKHTMTSVGLLLGISASYMGTMDSLITRMLSVHITSMLPLGAAELNVSPTTQTAGLMGIGLLYYNTQHRRMSEIMLHEIENMDVEDVDNGPDVLRDESYRLASGFALGLINLAKGKDLRSLYGMRLPERLLGVAVGPRPVNAVHIFDKATAGAIIAIALVYMKSGNMTIARKIDIPDTEPQFDQLRPDMLMLRTMARHLIMWDFIQAQGSRSGPPAWIAANMPACYSGKLQTIGAHAAGRAVLSSSDVPFYNIATGLAWVLSLRYAGSGDESARDEILTLLDYFHATKSKGDAYYYDAKLARSSLRRCIDVLALAAATVMAGTGDLKTFRYLRRLHGRTDAETPYGSHLAGHLAIGVLFLGGGTYTLGTSDFAIASLICAFYPLFPTDVHDNRVHLQAFRHLWIFAAEPRCIIVEDIDTRRPISMPLLLTLRDGSTKQIQAPCLLPELTTIATVQTADPAYWRVTLDFASNPAHLQAFRENQRISVRRCPAIEAHNSTFNATFAALNATHGAPANSKQEIWDWIFALPSLRQQLDRADIELILPPDVRSSMHTDERGTVVDDRLVLSGAVQSQSRDALWNLRLLFAWAEKARDEGEGRLRWIGREVVEALRAEIETRGRVAAAARDAT